MELKTHNFGDLHIVEFPNTDELQVTFSEYEAIFLYKEDQIALFKYLAKKLYNQEVE